MNEKCIVVGIGEILWDMLPGGKALGGAPANFAYHASQFGLAGYAVSAVGDDEPGREILETLDEKGLARIIETVGYPTGTVLVTLDGKGVPQYDICRDVAWDNIPVTQQTEALARKCRAVCFGTLAQRGDVSRTAIRRFLDLVPEGCLRVFDINLRQDYFDRELIGDSLKRCDILKINDEEVTVVAGLFGMNGASETEVCTRLLDEYGLDMVIETCGIEGSRVFSADEVLFLETPRVKVADTVGAGDSFTGAFIAALLRGKSRREAHRLAVDVSAYVCTQKGAMPVLPASLLI